jgi:transcription elongation factor GreA
MTHTIQYITGEKRAQLETELAELKGPKRKEILEALEYAKSLGDLSENAEYHQAREEQGKLEDRISKIELILKESQVVEKHATTVVEVGSTVTVKKAGDKEKRVFVIVGSEEADTAAGKISNTSPLGQALIGKKKGDDIVSATPKGNVSYSVVDVA